MRKLLFMLTVIGLGALLFFPVFAGGQKEEGTKTAPAVTSTSGIKYGGTLRVQMQWGPMTLNLNPLTASGQHIGITSEIYEALFYANPLTGKVTPLLGAARQWSSNNLELDVAIRQGVKWSDGQAFTAQDVLFTFDLIKKYKALDQYGIWSDISSLEKVEAGAGSVRFIFSKPNTPLFYFISQVMIVPKHIWSSVSDPTTYANEHPVGTGPFKFESFSSATNTVIAKRNPNYWMKDKPYIDTIQLTSVKSNTTTLLSMLKGDIDWSYSFIPDVKKTWVAKDPAVNKMWWPVNNTNILYLNTQKIPFGDPVTRKAISLTIDKNALLEKAYYGIGGSVNPTGIIPAQQAEWLDSSLKNEIDSLTYAPEKAAEMLAAAGYQKDSNGKLMDKTGNPLPSFKILVGAGWTDFITMAQIISANLKQIGIETTIAQEPWGTYISTLMSGTYDMAICWGTGLGPSPYYLYYQEFNPIFSASKIGENAQSNYARYTNPAITQALETYAASSDPAVQKKAIHSIERIVLKEIPFIPLTNRTNFGIFSEKKFVGWPSADDPYSGGGAIDTQDGEMVLLNVHLK